MDGVVHHIVTLDKYLKNRLPDDPWPDDAEDVDSNLVIYRDSDVGHIQGDSSAPSCSHDRLDFNRDLERHPVLRLGTGMDKPRSSWSPFWSNDPTLDFDLDSDIRRRGDISGNVSSKLVISSCFTMFHRPYVNIVCSVSLETSVVPKDARKQSKSWVSRHFLSTYT